MKIKQIVKPGLAVLAAGVLSACATKSNVKADGTTDNPVFPKPYSVTLDNKRGTFPTYDELDQMRPGLTKDDIYKILGRPHYDERYVRRARMGLPVPLPYPGRRYRP
ncbi:smpA / OmlA family protein [Neisseria meningitidis NM0552]|nr:smpA / OmlA family protein [Neisseria meningitidis NM0552]